MANARSKMRESVGGGQRRHYVSLILSFILAFVVSIGVTGSALAQTATPTETPTPTSTPTFTPTARALSVSGFAASNPIGQANSADVTAYFSYTTGATVLWTNDVIKLVKIPQGAIVTDWYLSCPDLDSSTTLTIDLGTSGDSNQFLAASTMCRAATKATHASNPNGLTSNAVPTSVYTDDDYLQILVTAEADPTPPAGGTISGYVRYNILGDAF